MYLSAAAQRDALLTLTKLGDRLESLRMRVIGVVGAPGGVAEDDGAKSVANWLDAHARTGFAAGSAAEKLGEALSTRWWVVAAGLEDGRVNLPQARVIVKALDALVIDPLPDEQVSPEVLARVEAHLVDAAARFNPRQLEALGVKILSVVAPETCDDRERKLLERAEKRAKAATRLTFHKRGDGSTDVHARVPDHVAGRLKTYLQAWTSPKQDDGKDTGAATGLGAFAHLDPVTGKRLPQERLLGMAFCSFLEAADPTRIPAHGGAATRVLITIDFEDLRDQLGHGTVLSNGEDLTQVSPHEIRRLACQADLIPVVLDGKSVPLDWGSASRFFKPHQRDAKMLTHQTCQTKGCSVPAQWCEGHHGGDNPWAHGGKTNLDQLRLLCPWHHHRAHDPDYETQWLLGEQVTFTRRQRRRG
ncbi:HNH endonuclease signature motif containing protein [Nocardioides solisilvae]|uniref:HNH endonuclease signature motif containing protein n=1 Tax=Nocardioides solisilvae TaxID=1542435 RepID=UPI0013A5A86B|nr:HNH endonuclease signature motif containing protein [Nocardioides solisilvae]